MLGCLSVDQICRALACEFRDGTDANLNFPAKNLSKMDLERVAVAMHDKPLVLERHQPRSVQS